MIGQRIISASMMLDGEGLDSKNNQGILVDNGVIKETGPLETLKKKYTTVEVTAYDDCCITPGLIDCHVHLVLTCSVPNYLDRLAMPEGEMAYTIVNNIKNDIKSGVTTARCMGDRFYLDILTRRLIEEGTLDGPHLKGCVPPPVTDIMEFRATEWTLLRNWSAITSPRALIGSNSILRECGLTGAFCNASTPRMKSKQ
jgi:imidazolonepropionase-like amidohydrolase